MSSIENLDEKVQLELTQAQAVELERTLALARALASPGRVAILGYLAARPEESLTVADFAGYSQSYPLPSERDLRQLAECGLIQIDQWQAPGPGREPVPYRVSLKADYFKTMPQMIAALHKMTVQLRPAQVGPAQDERAKTLGRFLKDGKLVSFPSGLKRQVWVVEEVARQFQPGLRYTERQVDSILKEIYEYDHCTLRRYLVDLNFLKRAEGVYWREVGNLPPV